MIIHGAQTYPATRLTIWFYKKWGQEEMAVGRWGVHVIIEASLPQKRPEIGCTEWFSVTEDGLNVSTLGLNTRNQVIRLKTERRGSYRGANPKLSGLKSNEYFSYPIWGVGENRWGKRKGFVEESDGRLHFINPRWEIYILENHCILQFCISFTSPWFYNENAFYFKLTGSPCDLTFLRLISVEGTNQSRYFGGKMCQ